MIPLYRPSLGEEEIKAASAVLESGWLGLGAKTQEFEQALGDFLPAAEVVALDSGTSALIKSLSALDVARKEVVVPSLTFSATVQAILATGATPVFCDIDPATLNLDVEDALARVTPSTAAILPVHIAGLAADIDALISGAHERGVRVVEDAAHAFGSKSHGRRIGSFGDVTCFSFDPIKNITCGTGGAVVTEDQEVVKKLRLARNWGIDRDSWNRYGKQQSWEYQIVSTGDRSHMNDLNAAIGLAQLQRAGEIQEQKQEIVRHYEEGLADCPGVVLIERGLPDTFPLLYIVRVTNGRRNALIDHLRRADIGTGVHFTPCHTQPAFERWRSSLPETEKAGKEVLSLPMFVGLRNDQVSGIIDEVRRFTEA